MRPWTCSWIKQSQHWGIVKRLQNREGDRVANVLAVQAGGPEFGCLAPYKNWGYPYMFAVQPWGMVTGRSWSSLASHCEPKLECPVQWESLSQTVREGTLKEDSPREPQTCTCTHSYLHPCTHIQNKSTHDREAISSDFHFYFTYLKDTSPMFLIRTFLFLRLDLTL